MMAQWVMSRCIIAQRSPRVFLAWPASRSGALVQVRTLAAAKAACVTFGAPADSTLRAIECDGVAERAPRRKKRAGKDHAKGTE